MNIIPMLKWGATPKKNPTRKEVRERYVKDSKMILTPLFDEANDLKELIIEIHGSASAIPSLKNRKLRNNIPNPDTMGRIDAMDILFREASQWLTDRISFGKNLVAMKLVCGIRSAQFDVDNALSTIKDWLEPAGKQVGKSNLKRKRGWGVGVVENDSQIIPFPITARRLENHQIYTLIHLRRWEDVREKAIRFYKEF